MKCSVIVPAYNAAATIELTLGALLRQTMRRADYEIIVIDDGSTDLTAELIKTFPGVIYRHQPNQGPAVARNAGAWLAQGEIIVFTDSDCEPAPDFLEKLLAVFAESDVSAAQGVYRTKQRELTARFCQAEFVDRYELMSKFDSIDLIATYAAAFRKEVFLRFNGFDESFPVANNEDTEFSYRLVEAGLKLVLAPAAIVYHQHPSSLRRYLKIKYSRALWRFVVYRKFPGKAVKDRYTPKVIKLQTLLGMIFCASLVCAPFSAWAKGICYLDALALFASSLPFALKSAGKDALVGLVSPGIIFLRALVFALGSLRGIVQSLKS